MAPERRISASGPTSLGARAAGWLIGIVLGLVLFGVIKTIDHSVPESSAGFEVAATATEPAATATVIPRLIIQEITRTPVSTATALIVPVASTSTPLPTLELTSTPNPIFIPPLEDAESRVFDSDEGDPEFDKLVRQHAANLSIPEPYEYQIYIVPDDTRYADVRDHYRDTLSDEGYKVTYDYQDEQDIYLFKMAKGEERVAVQFWAKKQDTSPAVMVLYFEAAPSK